MNKPDRIAIIVNSSEFKGHWFEGLDGEAILVKEYPYKVSKQGDVDCCLCQECVINEAGKEFFEACEVIEGCDNEGSVIPLICLNFI
jgi:hypothetical protein